MAPVVGGVDLPEALSGGQEGRLEGGRELEHASEEGHLARRNGNRLNDPGVRGRLHTAHQSEQGGTGHEAVGIQHHHEIVVSTPSLAEVSDIPHLSTLVGLTAPVDTATKPGNGSLHPPFPGDLLLPERLLDPCCR